MRCSDSLEKVLGGLTELYTTMSSKRQFPGPDLRLKYCPFGMHAAKGHNRKPGLMQVYYYQQKKQQAYASERKPATRIRYIKRNLKRRPQESRDFRMSHLRGPRIPSSSTTASRPPYSPSQSTKQTQTRISTRDNAGVSHHARGRLPCICSTS